MREAEARRATKELMAAQRQEEELRLKRNIEERAREKAEEARARDKIRVKLGPPPTAQSTLPFSRPTCILDSTAGHVSVSVQFHNVESCGQQAVKGTCNHAWDTPNSFRL